jgi:hypothetical protein
MNEFLTNLKKFNRKERFFLVGEALGNPDFKLSANFVGKIQKSLPGLSQPIPADAFVAMDYHLDWIYASLFLCVNPPARFYSRDQKLITANQEDVDLLVAFSDWEDENKTHLILCECKAESSWINKQLKSKADRFKNIFGENGDVFKNIVIPHFLLISPEEPGKLRYEDIPDFMKTNGKIPWMELIIPNDLQKITRCDSSGKDSEEGSYWKVKETRNILFDD